jgi:hypothetical protein
MAAIGGVLTKFAEQMTPGDVFGFIENQNTSELGKLVQKEAISPEMYMRGRMIEQVGDIAKGIVGNHREAIAARERVQTLGMQLARFAIEKLSGLQDKALELAKENQKIIREIVGENSEIGKTIASCYEKHLLALKDAFANTDPNLRTLMVTTYIDAYNSTKASLDAISRGNVEIVKAGTIDPAFFDACAKQTGLIISQVNQLAIELAKTEEGDFKVIASEVGQTVRCLITEGTGLTQSFIPWARRTTPALTAPSAPGGVAAIKGPEAPTGTPTTQPEAPSATPTTSSVPTDGAPITQTAPAGGIPSPEPAPSQTPTTTGQSGDAGGTSTSSSSSRWEE